MQFEYLEKWNLQIKDLLVQGDFVKLLECEQPNVSWKAIIYGVPYGVMEFAMRSATNTLATKDNLKWWKITRSDSCQMCQKPNSKPHKAKLLHILNHCDAVM